MYLSMGFCPKPHLEMLLKVWCTYHMTFPISGKFWILNTSSLVGSILSVHLPSPTPNWELLEGLGHANSALAKRNCSTDVCSTELK